MTCYGKCFNVILLIYFRYDIYLHIYPKDQYHCYPKQ